MSARTLISIAASALVASVAQAAAPPTDPQIAAIVVAANQVDIDAGKFAARQASTADVRRFAEQMVTDHGAVNAQATALVTKLKVRPQEGETSAALKEDGRRNLAALRELQGAKFDRAYVDHEVAYHEQVIQALDSTLIPNARNAELKGLLVKVRPAFVAHLEHAKHLQATLGGSTP
jgi:putative membrane protein